jgi:hypothetical protein
VLVLSFKYRSSPVREEVQKSRGLSHMQAQTAIIKERSPIKVEVYENGRLIHARVFNPRGIRKDASVFVYDEVLLKPGEKDLLIRLEETKGRKAVKEAMLSASIRQKDSLFITYDEGKDSFLVLR